MKRLLVALFFILVSVPAFAQCIGGAGVPFNCAVGNTPTASDLILGGSNTGQQFGKTIRWTIGQLGMTINGTPCFLAGTCAITTTATPGGSSGQLQLNVGGFLGGTSTIDGFPVGSVSPSTGAFTSLSATGTLTVNPLATNPLAVSSTVFQLTGTGNPNYQFTLPGTGVWQFIMSGGEQVRIQNTASTISHLTLQGGGPAGGTAVLGVGGDSTAGLAINPGSTGLIRLGNNVGAGTVVRNFLQFGSNQVYTAGSGITNGTTNPAMLWSNNSVSGAFSTGAAAQYYINSADSVNSTNGMYLLSVNQTLTTASGTTWNGLRQPFQVRQIVTAASAGGNGLINTTGFFAAYGQVGNQLNEGGVLGGPYGGGGTNLNVDILCNILYGNSCSGSEWDMRLMTASATKQMSNWVYAVNDGAHGIYQDATFSISRSYAVANGTGGAQDIIDVGAYASNWPIDPTLTNSHIIAAKYDPAGNQRAGGTPSQFYAGYGWDMPGVNFKSYAWRTTGHWIDGAGQLTLGPATFTYDTTGLYLNANYVTETSAAVNTAGQGYLVGDHLVDTAGGEWLVATIGGSPFGVTTVTPLTPARPGFASSCPGTNVATQGGVGNGVTLNVTCSSAANQITIGSTTINTILGAGAALTTTSTLGFPQIPTIPGVATSTVGALGKAVIYINSTSHKLCHSEGGGIWYDATGAACT
jgi:hypothetical protein